MSETVAAAAIVAPANGVKPVAPLKVAAVPPVQSKPVEPIDDTEEYVVDGKTIRLNKEQRKLQFQKALAADKRLKEAADEKAKLADFWKEFDSNPEAAIAKRGLDPSKVFAAHLEKRAKLELMTEEQRHVAQLEAERDAAKAEAKKYAEEQRVAKQQEIDQRNFQALEKQLVEAANKHQLDETPDVLAGLCDIAIEFIELDIAVSADQVAQEYMRRENEHVEQKDKKLHSVLKGEKLLKYLGDATLAEIKAAMSARDTSSLQSIPKPVAKPKTQVRAHERAIKGPHISENDFDKKFKL